MSDEAGDAVFCYGSLVLPEVMERVTGRRFERRASRLDGYRRTRLRARSYPGLVPQPGATTDGCLYLDVDAQSLARLDAFEGELYERRGVVVLEREAWVYVLAPGFRRLATGEPWRLEDFREHDLDDFWSGGRDGTARRDREG